MKPWMRNTAVGILLALFAYFVWPTPYHYGGGSGSGFWRRNRFTNRIQRWYGRWE